MDIPDVKVKMEELLFKLPEMLYLEQYSLHRKYILK
jgi:hypothetical protein